jgi:hypothetical protein
MVTVPLKAVQNFQADIDARVVSKRNTIFTAQPQMGIVLYSAFSGR